MSEYTAPGLTLPAKDYKYFDKAIKETYGKGIGEIAQVEPSFAFQAMRTGLTAILTRRGQRELVHQIHTQEGLLKTTAVIERKLDGESAYIGSVAHAMDEIVDKLVIKHEYSEADFVISVVRKPGLIGRLRNREPIIEAVAVIPSSVEQ